MIGFIVKKFIGSRNEREVKKLRPLVAQINVLEAELQKLPEEALRQKTAAWKDELSKIQDNDELAGRLKEILPEAFAVVKNACRRLWGTEITVRGHPLKWEMIPFDVQLIGGYALHSGKIAEMATGEGKTLVATLPVYLNALTGRGVHVVPGNDYLRENGMAKRKEDQVQRGHYYAIVDEVDSILIDEARTPLIISGPSVVVHDDQYAQFRPQVEALFHTQERLCNRFLSEAEELMAKLNPPEGSNVQNGEGLEREIGLLLYRVKVGQPKSEGLMKVLENPENLRIFQD